MQLSLNELCGNSATIGSSFLSQLSLNQCVQKTLVWLPQQQLVQPPGLSAAFQAQRPPALHPAPSCLGTPGTGSLPLFRPLNFGL